VNAKEIRNCPIGYHNITILNYSPKLPASAFVYFGSSVRALLEAGV